MRPFDEIVTPDSYARKEELTFAHCDRHKRARASALVGLAAAFAGYDYDARGLTHEVLYANREVFLLSRLALRVHECPRAGDVLTVTTWEDGIRGAHMQRVFELAGGDGGVRVSIRSEWILVDPETRKILRPGSFTAKPISVCPKAIDAPAPCKIVLPREGREELGTRRVMWSDLDGNGHVFSANYADIVWDYLPADLQDREFREFYIDYSREATLGQELRLEGVREAEGYRMEGRGPDGICFTARCVF